MWHERSRERSTGKKQNRKEIRQRLKESREIAIRGKHMARAQKGDACSFRQDDSKLGKSACLSSSTSESQTKIDEKKLFERQASQGDQFIG